MVENNAGYFYVHSIMNDGSLVRVAGMQRGKRGETPKDRQLIFKKANKDNKVVHTPPKELTAFEKQVVGSYEYKEGANRAIMIFRADRTAEAHVNGKVRALVTWRSKGKEVHWYNNKPRRVSVWRVNPDNSIRAIATIHNGNRKDALGKFTWEKVSGISSGGSKDDHTQEPDKPTESPNAKPPHPEVLGAYYPFNGNAKDESGNGHDGKVKGAVLAPDRHGKIGRAYSLDGKDDFIEVSHDDAVDLGNGTGKEWTVSIWLKTNIESGGWLLRKGGRGGSGTRDYGAIASAKGKFTWGTGKSAANGGSDVTDWMGISHEVSSDEWHHVVGTYKQGVSNEGVKIFYIDGQVAGKAASGTRKNSAKNDSMRIGAGAGAHWQGLLDDVRIYNRALSEEQVKALYDLEKPND